MFFYEVITLHKVSDFISFKDIILHSDTNFISFEDIILHSDTDKYRNRLNNGPCFDNPPPPPLGKCPVKAKSPFNGPGGDFSSVFEVT